MATLQHLSYTIVYKFKVLKLYTDKVTELAVGYCFCYTSNIISPFESVELKLANEII